MLSTFVLWNWVVIHLDKVFHIPGFGIIVSWNIIDIVVKITPFYPADMQRQAASSRAGFQTRDWFMIQNIASIGMIEFQVVFQLFLQQSLPIIFWLPLHLCEQSKILMQNNRIPFPNNWEGRESASNIWQWCPRSNSIERFSIIELIQFFGIIIDMKIKLSVTLFWI